MSAPRHYSLIDRILTQVDDGLRTIFAESHSKRPDPAADISETKLTAAEKTHSAGLMRVNHTGEICAQALYRGQLQLARSTKVKTELAKAAAEETDHLAWCHTRLQELHSHRSYLNPLWYTGSYCLGLLAAAVGDRWSLGFIEETEAQVGKHLHSHLGQLPSHDAKSRAIVKQMALDEAKHGQTAHDAGAAELPKPIRIIMKYSAKLMTGTAYWL